MKRLTTILSVFAAVLFLYPSANAEALGTVLTTDIVAYIDHLPVPAYNIDGYTAVIIRDLEKYGYTVIWDEADRSVTFYRDFSVPVEGIIPKYEPYPLGAKLFDVYHTDIVVYFGETQIPAYNIGGRTAVRLRDISTVKEVMFDSDAKTAELVTYEVEFFDDEIEYMRNHFSGNIFKIAEAEYMQQQLFNKIESGTVMASDIEEFKSFTENMNGEFDSFKVYKEPYGFDASAMELWWAMVNSRFASECLISMAQGGDKTELTREYLTYRADSSLQRQRAMIQLYDDMMSVTFMWD